MISLRLGATFSALAAVLAILLIWIALSRGDGPMPGPGAPSLPAIGKSVPLQSASSGGPTRATPRPCITSRGTAALEVEAASRAAAVGGAVCLPAGSYAGPIVAGIPGQDWLLDDDAVLTSQLRITAPDVRILGGKMESEVIDPWRQSLIVMASGVTIEGVSFRGGGQVVSVMGVDDVRILRNDFIDQVGTAIFVWGHGAGADRVTIEGNTIQQTLTLKASAISSRGSEDAASVFNRQLVIRDNVIDQGSAEQGWFGIELTSSPEALIEGNEVSGGWVLVSLPVSDSSVVRGNTFDMRGSPFWGVEIARSNDVEVAGNRFLGRGSTGGQTAVSMNSGSLRASIHDNVLVAIGTLVDLSGDHHQIVDNCLESVGHEFEHADAGGPNILFRDNGAC